jgi:UDP-GlcNAc3NAcA epimerase
MKLLSVVGARPQLIKASPFSIQLRKDHREILVHTGQHYDPGMSDVFFEELGIPTPDHHLGIGSGSHGVQTGAMLGAIETVIEKESPDGVVVYGDTNSTLAAALAAAKLNVPVAHIEAGLRSFNRRMPEEVNRVLTDHVSSWLFTPSAVATRNLAVEGITRQVHEVGDIMVDALRMHGARAAERSLLLDKLGLAPGGYYLATVHRAENTDDRVRLTAILAALAQLNCPVLLPLHPRTEKRLTEMQLTPGSNVLRVAPLGYLDMLQAQRHARAILTDSGGVQKEAYYLRVPCLTLRDETEWLETVATGWNTLTGADTRTILEAAARIPSPDTPHPDLYGDGCTAKRIVGVLADTLQTSPERLAGIR